MRVALVVAIGAALTAVFLACTGDETDAVSTNAPASDGGTGGTLVPDAAPPANCPLECLPPAPGGWTGPSAMFEGAAADKPGCATPYTLPEVEAHAGLNAAPAACGCGEPVVEGARCTANVRLWATNTCNSGTPLLDGVVASDGCHVVRTFRNSLDLSQPAFKQGTCTFPSETKTVPPSTVEKMHVACGLPQVASCAARADCVAAPLPTAPFSRLCIHKEGEELCPSADYAKRFVAYKTIDDQRGCSACSASIDGGKCGTQYGVGGCDAGTSPTTRDYDDCIDHPGLGAQINIRATGPTGVTCTKAAGIGLPIGAASSTEPVTFCCNK